MAHQDSTTQASGPGSAHGYLRAISLQNVRCFRDKSQLRTGNTDAWARWTVLLGDNGVGKTTLLQAIAASAPALEQFSDGSVLSTPRISSGWPAGWPERATTEAPVPACMADWSAGPRGAVYKLGFRQDSAIQAAMVTYTVAAPVLDSRVFGYGASRAMGRRSLTPEEAVDPLATLFSTDAQLLNAAEWLMRLDYDESKKSDAAKRQKARVVELLTSGLLPDVTGLTFLGSAGVLAKTPFGDVPLDGLGLGYQTVLAWLVDLVWRMFTAYPDLEDPLSGPATVLVDEIDLHLHPRWQRQIIDHLTKWFPNTQWIVTAHSPLIVQAAEDANIAVLRREGDHVVIDQTPENVRNWRVDQILTSELFGLETARPPRVEKLLDERQQLLSKKRKSAKDRARIEAIEAEINEMETGETPEDRAAMALIRRAAASLKP
jgi:hypothetical protein